MISEIEAGRRHSETVIQEAIHTFQQRYEDREDMDLDRLLLGIQILTKQENAEVYMSLTGPLQDLWLRSEITQRTRQQAARTTGHIDSGLSDISASGTLGQYSPQNHKSMSPPPGSSTSEVHDVFFPSPETFSEEVNNTGTPTASSAFNISSILN